MLPAGVIGLGTRAGLEQEDMGAGEGGPCGGRSVSKGADIGKYEMERESCFCSRGSCKQPGVEGVARRMGGQETVSETWEPGGDQIRRTGPVWRLFSGRGDGGEREDES